jgi:Domain of unknown function (DUF1833)
LVSPAASCKKYEGCHTLVYVFDFRALRGPRFRNFALVNQTVDRAVAAELVPQIRAALGTRQYIQILYREYLGSDLTEPAYGPIEFELRNVQMVGASLTGTAMMRNLQNKRFLAIKCNYDYVQFPSL